METIVSCRGERYVIYFVMFVLASEMEKCSTELDATKKERDEARASIQRVVVRRTVSITNSLK